ncbi:tumor protein p53-inducible nuclear protein 1 [Amia ocellicauda]|uniref:tumor protein p53-inducible nuclear protein 1 n=1 Tax=Amia ocellicauda TaxID=2972642 RepID=UPI0034649899|nr:T53I1 protein [Amia calva]
MFHRFSSVLFGDAAEQRNNGEPEFSEKEDDDEWILVDYLEACTNTCGEGAAIVCAQDPSPPDCPALFSSCSSLASSMDPVEAGFLQLESCGLEESWFITPPPCFTAGGRAPVLLETSPLENLLIEHPSMSVYTVHNPRASLKDTNRRPLDQSLLRIEAPHRMGQHIGCYAAALSAHTGFLEQAKHARLAQRTKDNIEKQRLSRSFFRRQNLLRDSNSRQVKSSGVFVHQPAQRQFNY